MNNNHAVNHGMQSTIDSIKSTVQSAMLGNYGKFQQADIAVMVGWLSRAAQFNEDARRFMFLLQWQPQQLLN